MGIGELRGPVVGRDTVSLQLRPHDLHLARHHGVDPEGEIGDGDRVLQRVVAPVEGPLLNPGKVEDRLPKGLGRNRPRVEADAADHLLAIDDRDALADLGGGDGALLAGRPRADDDEVIVILQADVSGGESIRTTRPAACLRRGGLLRARPGGRRPIGQLQGGAADRERPTGRPSRRETARSAVPQHAEVLAFELLDLERHAALREPPEEHVRRAVFGRVRRHARIVDSEDAAGNFAVEARAGE
jgi:hypothetical protein